MFQHGGFYLPEGDEHFVRHYGDDLASYQAADREAAYKYVRQWRTAVDLGANIGLFSRAFAGRFETVWAFEPVERIRACLELNVPGNVIVQPYAVGDRPSIQRMHRTVKNSGGAYIFDHPDIPTPNKDAPPPHRSVEVEVRTLDSFDITEVDLIKLDIQGSEYLALKGGEQTIRKYRPVILIEEKPRLDDPLDIENVRRAADLLTSWGMTAREKLVGDRVYSF